MNESKQTIIPVVDIRCRDVSSGSDGTAAHALRDGAARVLAAPSIVAGTLALTLVFSLPPGLFRGAVVMAQQAAVALLLPFGAASGAPYFGAAWVLVWAFLLGGILDRYARNRPTRGQGFFGACGRHFPAMLRLGLVELLVVAGIGKAYAGNGAVVLFLAAGLVFVYARVRLVVEDRRSAAGALLAGGRFIRRNAAAAAAVFAVFAGLLWIGAWIWPALPQAGLRQRPLAFAGAEALVAVQLLLLFALLASATSLFQSRLAHASYAAAPAIAWPESSAAEAIRNLSPSGLS